jgi:hypothetical protein
MTQRPEPHVRRAVRVLAMIGELHRRGYQKLRVMPFMNSSGTAWRCWIGPDTLFYRNHGAYLRDTGFSDQQPISLSARYTTGEENHYFGWEDAEKDDARTLAEKFLARFTELSRQGEGWSYAYAGWYQRLLGLADRGWMPVVIDDNGSSTKKINLYDLRPAEWRTGSRKKPLAAFLPYRLRLAYGVWTEPDGAKVLFSLAYRARRVNAPTSTDSAYWAGSRA